ncbi:MAG TPA: DEAD/DEAH box helicase [Bacteroidales bacterium]|nr:DEAD/DEAH box helicase [Bacteroidales bacterium]
MSLNLFHPAVATWFEKTFEQPTGVQTRAWESINSGQPTLIVAPTGSGKTLAAFLSVIDDMVRQGLEDKLQPVTKVVYVSPLKALSNDIERNLQLPLKGIRKELEKGSRLPVDIRVMVRTGDTTTAERTNMIKHPPHILVTTPESLYLLLTSNNGRTMLSNVETLIIDEIHALVGDKRGSHLALSVERLEALTSKPLHRIGLSATLKPVQEVARFLTGTSNRLAHCRIIDAGHSRHLDLSVEVPRSPLTSIMANEVWEEIYDKLIGLIADHQTTLIFVNTRRLAERLSHNLNERLGPGRILAHHGSMSKDRRVDAENRLKNGSLKALVATSSLELGIDVGAIELVCQIGAPHSIASFLQRVGRSGHSVNKTPKGILFPLTLDELVDCVAILDAIRKGDLDHIIIPEKPLDVLAQQIVAETAGVEYSDDDLFSLVTKAYPYQNLTRNEFDDVVTMMAEGYTSRKGRRGALLYHDRINQRIKARKGARLTALISGGAIPDNFEFDVVLDPENIFLGTVNEDFAMESIPGDIFQLGNNSWKIRRIENGKVRVEDAAGQPPNIPFWLGEAPGRSKELSQAVSRLREEITGETVEKEKIVTRLVMEKGISIATADQLVDYLTAAKAALGSVPTQEEIVMERFFDEAGDMHLVIHSPFGSRLNKAWGLALRKRFCRKFNFELQAAANDNSIILSLGPTHSFPLEEVFNYLSPVTVRSILVQAMLDAPVFAVRWRWNASRALAVARRSGGKKVPAQIQRMQAEDLMAHVFPDQLACLENIEGDREIPDHPLVNQTIHDCLYEAMDIEGLENLLKKIKNKKIRLSARDLKEPSPLAREIIAARPYAFLDNAPFEERRTLAIRNRRWLSPGEAADIGRLDPQAIEAVKEEAWPRVENADELHDAILLSGFLTKKEAEGTIIKALFVELARENRATMLDPDNSALIIAAENLPLFLKIYPGINIRPEINIPERLYQDLPQEKDPLTEIIRGRMEISGPVTAEALSNLMHLPARIINQVLYRLENEGFVLRGNFTGEGGTEWCERRLLARIHRYTVKKLRSEIQPVSAADYMRFLFSWHQAMPGNLAQGPVALEHILQKLEGFEAPAVAWEGDILPSRIADYDYQWLDMLCVSGKISWGRFRPPVIADEERKMPAPVKTTQITFVTRMHLDIWRKRQTEAVGYLTEFLSPKAQQVYELLLSRGAMFFDDILSTTGLFQSQAEEVLGELISSGIVTSDSFTGLRALLVPGKYKTSAGRRRDHGLFSMNYAGRWSLLTNVRQEDNDPDPSTETETIAWALLRRYGILFRKLVEKENLAPPWRELVKVLRLLELQGRIRGGRFVDGVWGEQFALPEAITELRQIIKTEKTGTLVSIGAADPLNLTGILLPGKRVSGHYGNRILFRDGVPVAFQEAREIRFPGEPGQQEKWNLQARLVQRTISPMLRKYLGKLA